MNKQNLQSLVWGGILITLGVLTFVQNIDEISHWVWVAAMVASGTAVLGLYSLDRSVKWLLIPSYIMLAVAAFVTLISLDFLRDPFIASFVLVTSAIPFLAAFQIGGRIKWGLLVPAYILIVISIMVPLIEIGVLEGMFVAPYVLFAMAVPFFVVYALNSKHWWALIPGGIFSVSGLSFLISVNSAKLITPSVLIIVGLWIVVRSFSRKEIK